MENINKLLESLHLEKNIKLEDIPNVDLYVDQVVQLFEILMRIQRELMIKSTNKTMINNYAKRKIFIPIKIKSISKEHMILISLIYQIKRALSINDIKSSLKNINEPVNKQRYIRINTLYKDYLSLTDTNVEKLLSNM